MKYRKLKRCNNQTVSEIALGCEGFFGKTEEEKNWYYRGISARYGKKASILEPEIWKRQSVRLKTSCKDSAQTIWILA